MIIFLPISYPLAKILDRCIGHGNEKHRFKTDELKTLITMHGRNSN